MEKTEELFSKTAELRSNRRMKLRKHQGFNRMKAFDSNRFVESEVLTEKDVAGLCSRIKRRKHATEQDLRKLSNAFIQSAANITAFIKTTGAINIIIKEFTGSDRSQQLLAAQCLCNLSLGDETCCLKIATFTGSYLMIFIMKSSDVTFSRICLWITQSLAAAGSKPLNIMLSQELLKNCLHIICNSVEHLTDAIQLLDIIIESHWNELDDNEKLEIQASIWNILKKSWGGPLALQTFCKIITLKGLNICGTNQIFFVLMRNLHSLFLNDEPLNYFTVKLLMKSIQLDQRNVINLARILILENVKLSVLINWAAARPKFYYSVSELMLVTSVLYTSEHPATTQYFDFDPIENIQVPKIFEF